MVIEEINFPRSLFISGIDTDAGKSYATGIIARGIAQSGQSVITQKFIQTGNRDWSEDIEVHRKIMEIELQPRDLDHTTAPEIYSYPASPHLSARIDNRPVNLSKITDATTTLLQEYDHVLIEGAGGLMVPISEDYLTIDYIKDQNLPVLLVVTGQLGSLNHAILSLHALKTYGIKLFGIAYNLHFDKDPVICAETRNYLRQWIINNDPTAVYFQIPSSPLK